jgi:peptidylprolyl isomerase/FKBP-type peptidyl-prolyl cis-trans isomerase FklB
MNQKNRMKKYIGIALAVLLLSACGKDDIDLVAEAWKKQNEQAFNALANNPDYTELKSLGNNGSLYYRVIQKGEGNRLFYNSRAEVYYKGWFVATNEDYKIKAGDVFDKQQFDDGATFKVNVYDLPPIMIAGWNIVLQFMVEGDKWEVWIPHSLAYAAQGSGKIPGYTTLAFEIEVIKAID